MSKDIYGSEKLNSLSTLNKKSDSEAMLSRFPKQEADKLRSLKLSPEQLKYRLAAIVKLDEYINDDSKFSRGDGEAGVSSFLKHAVTLDSTREGIQNQMKEIRRMLLESFSSQNNTNGWDKQIETHLNKINKDGTANLEFDDTKMSQRVFLQRIIGPQATGIILQDAIEQSTILKREDIEKKAKLSRFLLVLEEKGDPKNDNNIRHTQELLSQGKVDEAIGYAKKFIDGKYKGISVAQIISEDQSGIADAMRALGNTTAASKEYEKAGARDIESDTNASSQKLKGELKDAFTNPNNYLQEATSMYDKTIKSLPYNHPDRAILENNKQDSILSIQAGMIIAKTIQGYIKKNGAEGLPASLLAYNDMKGLYGWFNFTDENAKMTREIAIMVASFIVTAGVSAAISSIAAGARVGGIARFANATNHFRNGNYMRGAISGISSAATAIGRTTAVGLDAASKVPGLGIFGNAFAFTASDTVLRSLWNQNGEEYASFEGFAKKLASNTAMFAAFSGMEKFLSGPLSARFMNGIPSSTVIGGVMRGGVEIATLSAGDIAVMQGLYAAENGKFDWDWKSAFEAIAYRIGMTGAQRLFPRLTAQQNIISSGTPPHISGTPPHISGTPPHISGTPPHISGTPPHISGTPPHISGTPPHISGTPPHISGTPPHISGTPPHISGTPPHISGTPPHISGTPPKFNSFSEYFNSYPKEIQNRIKNISNQIGKINTDAIIAVPVYAKEDLTGLISSLKMQKPSGEKIVLYVNAPKTGPYAVSESEFITKITDLKRITQDDPRFVIASQHYDARKTIGEIRSDMVDSISHSLDPHVKNPILIGLDADLYKLSDNYVNAVRKHFHDNPNKDWAVAQLRWGVPGIDQASWLSERLMQSKFIKEDFWSSGGSSSFRLDTYQKVGGYDRMSTKGEDTALGKAMDAMRGSDAGSKLGLKVTVDPRRGTETIQNGGRFEDQWNGGFNPVNKGNFDTLKMQEINALTEKMRTGSPLSNTEIKTMEDFIQKHNLTGDASEKFARFWNMTATDSKYAMVNKSGKLGITERATLPAGYRAEFINLSGVPSSIVSGHNTISGGPHPTVSGIRNSIGGMLPPNVPAVPGPKYLGAYVRTYGERLGNIAGMLGIIALLAYLYNQEYKEEFEGEMPKNQNGIPHPDTIDTSSVEAVANYCESCYSGSYSVIDTSRKIKGRQADVLYRKTVSEIWTRSKEWKKVVDDFTKNEAFIPNGNFKNVMKVIISGNYTFLDVQELQHCIKMLQGGQSVDSKESQDGMLGKITTKAISDYIAYCQMNNPNANASSSYALIENPKLGGEANMSSNIGTDVPEYNPSGETIIATDPATIDNTSSVNTDDSADSGMQPTASNEAQNSQPTQQVFYDLNTGKSQQ